jgi:hypothetical protein
MKAKPLIETNPYLKDPAMRKKLIARSVRTSCGVEGIKASSNIIRFEIPHRKDKKIYKTVK